MCVCVCWHKNSPPGCEKGAGEDCSCPDVRVLPPPSPSRQRQVICFDRALLVKTETGDACLESASGHPPLQPSTTGPAILQGDGNIGPFFDALSCRSVSHVLAVNKVLEMDD